MKTKIAEDINLKEIGSRIELTRKKLKLKQKEFARQLKISNSSLSGIENGESRPSFELFYHMTKKYNINIYYLLHGKGEMFMPDDFELSFRPKSDTSEYKFIKMFLSYFDDSPFFRYNAMSLIENFLQDNEKTVLENIEWNKKKKQMRPDGQ